MSRTGNDEQHALKTEVASLRADLDRVRASPTAPERTPHVERDGVELRAPAPVVARDADPRVVAENLKREQARMVQHLDARIDGENIDRAWSQETETAVRSTIGSVDPNVTVEAVTCKSSLCRVKLSLSSSEARRQFPQAIATQQVFRAGVTYASSETDDNAMTLYVQRFPQDASELLVEP
jgi:hypothetical protein